MVQTGDALEVVWVVSAKHCQDATIISMDSGPCVLDHGCYFRLEAVIGTTFRGEVLQGQG